MVGIQHLKRDKKKYKYGEYIRTKCGKIDKVINNKYYMQQYIECEKGLYLKENIIKHSKNIIDLIEVGDIVEVLDHDWTRVFNIDDEDILESFIEDCKEENWKLQGAMTREIYKQNCYKIDTN